jgi:hypothetical protein
MSIKIVKISKKISNKGYPVHTKSGKISKIWKKAHAKANIAARKKFGSKKAKRITKLVKKTPKDQLLGKHTKRGRIIVSKIVPKGLRLAIVEHEKVEHRIMENKNK